MFCWRRGESSATLFINEVCKVVENGVAAASVWLSDESWLGLAQGRKNCWGCLELMAMRKWVKRKFTKVIESNLGVEEEERGFV